MGLASQYYQTLQTRFNYSNYFYYCKTWYILCYSVINDAATPWPILWLVAICVYAALLFFRALACHTIFMDIFFLIWDYLYLWNPQVLFLVFLVLVIYLKLFQLVWQYYSDEFNDLYQHEIKPDFYEDLCYDFPYLKDPEAIIWKLTLPRSRFVHEPIFMFLVSAGIKILEVCTLKTFFLWYSWCLALLTVVSLFYLTLVVPYYVFPVLYYRLPKRPRLRKIFISDFRDYILEDHHLLDSRVLDLEKEDPDLDRLDLIFERPQRVFFIYTHKKLKLNILFKEDVFNNENAYRPPALKYKRFIRLRWHYSPIVSILRVRRPPYTLYTLSVSFWFS